MRPLYLREWPFFYILWKLGQGTAREVLHALATEQPADRHSVRAVLEEFVAQGYARSERSYVIDEDGERVEIVTYFPVVEPEEALRAAWPELREVMLDRGRYLDFFRELVERSPGACRCE